MDFYQIIGVSRDADAETIKKAYKKLAKECHPDTHPGDRQAEERFKLISEAYSVLSDDEKRKLYDRKAAAAGEKQRQNAARKANTREKKDGKQGQGRENPLDTSALFEKYMGFKL